MEFGRPTRSRAILVDLYQAKSKLSSLLERAQAGEEVVVTRAGKPIARLVPVAAATGSRSGVRFGGLDAKRLNLAPDFHAPLTDDDLLGR